MNLRDPQITSGEIRDLIRIGQFSGATSGMAPGHIQTNLVILSSDDAFDFLLFCQRNPRSCPLLEVVESGSSEPTHMAPAADLRSDLPKYFVYKDGTLVEEPTDISHIWNEDLVSFLIGCSFTFESALIAHGIPIPHYTQGKSPAMFTTTIPTEPAGIFAGPMVVSMRAIPQNKLVATIQITAKFPQMHAAPIHIGNPSDIGINDISKPDFGDPVEVREGFIPVFWACGVTPQAVALSSKPSMMITHAPGHMFITDKKDSELMEI